MYLVESMERDYFETFSSHLEYASTLPYLHTSTSSDHAKTSKETTAQRHLHRRCVGGLFIRMREQDRRPDQTMFRPLRFLVKGRKGTVELMILC